MLFQVFFQDSSKEIFHDLEDKKTRLPRLERGTYGLEVRCSILLSYRRIGVCANLLQDLSQ